MQKMSTCSFHQLFSDLQSDREWFTSHVRWKFEFIWSVVTSNQVVVSAYLRHMQSQLRFHSSEISYKFALRHVSMRRSHLFAKRPNSRSSDLHMLAKTFRANSRFPIHVSEFSKIFHLDSICRRCQRHFVTYLLSSWLTLIVSRTGSSGIFMKISTLGKYWPEKVTKVICFRTQKF